MADLNITNDDVMPTSLVVQQAKVDISSVEQAHRVSYWKGGERHGAWRKGDVLLTLRESGGVTDQNQNNPKVFKSISGLGQGLYNQGVPFEDASRIIRQLYVPVGISLSDYVPRVDGHNGNTMSNNLISMAVAGGAFKLMNTGKADICAGDEVMLMLPNPAELTPKDTIGHLTKDYNPNQDEYNLVTKKYTPVDTYLELRNIAQSCLRDHELYVKMMKQSIAGRDDTSNTRSLFTGLTGIGLLFLNILLKKGVVTLNPNRMRDTQMQSQDDITNKDDYDNLVASGDDDRVADRVTGLIGRMLGLIGNVKDESDMLPLLQDTLPDSDQTDEGEVIMKEFFRSVFIDPTDAHAIAGYRSANDVSDSLHYTDSGIFVNTDTELGQLHDTQLKSCSNAILSLLQFNANVKSWVIGVATTSAPPGQKFNMLLTKSNPQ